MIYKENKISIKDWSEIEKFIPDQAYSSGLIKILGKNKEFISVIFKLELAELFNNQKDNARWVSLYNDLTEYKQQCIESEYQHSITYLSYMDTTPEELRANLNKKYYVGYLPGKFLVEFIKYYTDE